VLPFSGMEVAPALAPDVAAEELGELHRSRLVGGAGCTGKRRLGRPCGHRAHLGAGHATADERQDGADQSHDRGLLVIAGVQPERSRHADEGKDACGDKGGLALEGVDDVGHGFLLR